MSRSKLLDSDQFPFDDDEFGSTYYRLGDVTGRGPADGADSSGLPEQCNRTDNDQRNLDSGENAYKKGVVVLSVVVVVLLVVCFSLVVVCLNLKRSNELLSEFKNCIIHDAVKCAACSAHCAN